MTSRVGFILDPMVDKYPELKEKSNIKSSSV